MYATHLFLNLYPVLIFLQKKIFSRVAIQLFSDRDTKIIYTKNYSTKNEEEKKKNFLLEKIKELFFNSWPKTWINKQNK